MQVLRHFHPQSANTTEKSHSVCHSNRTEGNQLFPTPRLQLTVNTCKVIRPHCVYVSIFYFLMGKKKKNNKTLNLGMPQNQLRWTYTHLPKVQNTSFVIDFQNNLSVFCLCLPKTHPPTHPDPLPTLTLRPYNNVTVLLPFLQTTAMTHTQSSIQRSL